MAYDGLTVVDIDAHYLEDVRSFATYLNEPHRTRFRGWSGRYLLPLLPGEQQDSMLHGHVRRGPRRGDEADGRGDGDNALPQIGMLEPSDIPRAMEHLGIDYIVLIPSYMLTVGHVRNREHAVAVCEGFASYMTDRCVDPSRGIYTSIVAPTQDPEAAAKLIRDYGSHDGVCAVTIACGIDPALGSDLYDPIYRAAEEQDLPIVIHADFQGPDLSRFQKFPRWSEAHALDFVFAVAISLTSAVLEGLPERFPNLRFVFEEAGVMWAPALMSRLDTEYRRRREDSPLLKRLPSEYLGDNLFIGTQPIESPRNIQQLRHAFDALDAKRSVLYATDWPHYDYDEPAAIADLPFLTAEERANIMGETALRVFRFNGPAQNVRPQAEAVDLTIGSHR
jgi:uncharacterized protein